MYIHRVRIKNIRSIASLDWKIRRGREAGWHVILGDNGSGKSTFVCAIALAFIGPGEALALRKNWEDWLRFGDSSGSIQLDLTDHKDIDQFPSQFKPPEQEPLGIIFGFKRGANGRVDVLDPPSRQPIWGWGREYGWFSAAYGAFRRFSGGDTDYEEPINNSYPRLAAHLSVFDERVALTECLRWLQDLKFKQYEKKPEGGLLDKVKAFVNHADFLPFQVRLDEVTSEGVEFVDGNGCRVPVVELSAGYRSILSLTFDLIRQLARCYGPDNVFDRDDPTKIVPPGVVLIDEPDAHLHPTWQQRIGFWFREHFPNLQFIVATHSPLVCQAATTVWRLPAPGSDEPGGMVTGQDLDRLLYGDILDAFGTELFGEVTRSEEGLRRLERLAELNLKELRESLTDAERQEQARLRASTPTAAHTLGRDNS